MLESMGISDEPHPSGADRYCLYRLRAGEEHVRLCETSLDGIGLALVTMLAENQIARGDKFGLFDKKERRWLINPFL